MLGPDTPARKGHPIGVPLDLLMAGIALSPQNLALLVQGCGAQLAERPDIGAAAELEDARRFLAQIPSRWGGEQREGWWKVRPIRRPTLPVEAIELCNVPLHGGESRRLMKRTCP